MSIDILADKRRVALYDLSIPEIGLRSANRLEFDSIKDAANFLGYVPHKLGEIIKNKHYAYHRGTNKKYAARIIKQ